MFTYRQQIKSCKLGPKNVCELCEEFKKLSEPDELLRPSDCGLCAGCIENHIHGGMESCEGPPDSYRLWYKEINGLLELVQKKYNSEWGVMSKLQENAWKELSYYWKPLQNTANSSPKIYKEDSYDSDIDSPDNYDSPHNYDSAHNSLNATWR